MRISNLDFLNPVDFLRSACLEGSLIRGALRCRKPSLGHIRKDNEVIDLIIRSEAIHMRVLRRCRSLDAAAQAYKSLRKRDTLDPGLKRFTFGGNSQSLGVAVNLRPGVYDRWGILLIPILTKYNQSILR